MPQWSDCFQGTHGSTPADHCRLYYVLYFSTPSVRPFNGALDGTVVGQLWTTVKVTDVLRSALDLPLSVGIPYNVDSLPLLQLFHVVK